MRFACKIKYKDKMIEIYVTEDSLKYLKETCIGYYFNALNLTHTFIVHYYTWEYIMESLQNKGLKI